LKFMAPSKTNNSDGVRQIVGEGGINDNMVYTDDGHVMWRSLPGYTMSWKRGY